MAVYCMYKFSAKLLLNICGHECYHTSKDSSKGMLWKCKYSHLNQWKCQSYFYHICMLQCKALSWTEALGKAEVKQSSFIWMILVETIAHILDFIINTPLAQNGEKWADLGRLCLKTFSEIIIGKLGLVMRKPVFGGILLGGTQTVLLSYRS